MARRHPRREPARPTAAEMRSSWSWARSLPRRSVELVSLLWRTERRRTVLGLLAVLVGAGVLAALGAGGETIWEILAPWVWAPSSWPCRLGTAPWAQ